MNDRYFWTNHARKRLIERGEIQESWVIDTIENPERSEFIIDQSGEKYHYYKIIIEFDHQVLEVVTSAKSTPIRIITMIVTYDADIDAIYFKLNNNKIDSTEPETERIIIDYDKENNIVGVEILDFQYFVKKGLTIDDLPFSEEEKRVASQYFPLPIIV